MAGTDTDTDGTADDGEAPVDAAAIARGWLLASRVATLCTIAAQRDLEGYPYGSVVPYALTADGHPFVLVADIAAHTANLRRDPRASLFVRQPDPADDQADPQAGWRLTVLGPMARVRGPGEAARPGDVAVDADELEELDARYRARVPAADAYRRTHGFGYWRMTSIVKARYIAGFGAITWIPGEGLVRDPGGAGLREAGPGAVAHMNDDHAANLVEMVAGLHGFTPARARMVSVDRGGMLVRAEQPDRLVHFSFDREITAGELRVAVIEVLRRARAARDCRNAG